MQNIIGVALKVLLLEDVDIQVDVIAVNLHGKGKNRWSFIFINENAYSYILEDEADLKFVNFKFYLK